MIDNELLLFDRIEKIKQINKEYDLEKNAYISFSGGKDSTVLHYLIDMALPNNNIPRVYLNTGIEYFDIVKFVKQMQAKDGRIVINNSGVNIKKMLEEKGYPFKSKEHAHKMELFQNGSTCEFVKKYLDFESNSRYRCPKILRCQLDKNYPLKISDKCCYELKKKPAHKWAKENHKSIVMVGLRMEEGGQRVNAKNCLVFDKKEKLKEFKPINPITDEWTDWFIESHNIQLCKLYYPPFNFKRTGCKGCPFSLDLQKQLDVMEKLLPAEKNQCEVLWKPVYDEYRRIGYRIRKKGTYYQTSIDDFL